MANSSKPTAPGDPAKLYLQGLQSNLKYAPQIAGTEQDLRNEFDGPGVQASLTRQANTGGSFLDLYRQDQSKTNPGNEALQKQLGGALSTDLAKGYQIDPDQRRAAEQSARAGQVATGNFLGNAAVTKEVRAVGAASFSAHQKRITNAEKYLAVDNAVKEYTNTMKLVTGATSPDRSSQYVTTSAGGTFQGLANQTYQQDINYLGTLDARDYYSPWQRTLNGGLMGYREGSLGGIWGGFFGAIFGAIDGLGDGPIYNMQLDYGFGGANASALFPQYAGNNFGASGNPWASATSGAASTAASQAASYALSFV